MTLQDAVTTTGQACRFDFVATGKRAWIYVQAGPDGLPSLRTAPKLRGSEKPGWAKGGVGVYDPRQGESFPASWAESFNDWEISWPIDGGVQ